MGEVYRARDARLGREVAIKVLPEQFADDPERLARFEREAQLLASLNHPNIAHIHGLEESGGVHALVMELVEGDTLADRLARGALPVDDTLAIAAQIADALQYAHDHGVVHRDLKPANVKLTADGTAKVLDFGLAKAMGGDDGAESDPNATHSPTITAGHTRAGVILGTAAYMSPEQARGKSVDKRTDIWAFGSLVYECLTGRQAFSGETISDTISLILQREPDWSALPANTPASVRRLLARCLEKDAKKRLRDIGDARLDINDASRAGEAGAAGYAAPRSQWSRGRVIAWSGAVLVLGAAIGFALRGGRAPAPATSTGASGAMTCVSIAAPPGMRVQQMALAPDGRHIVFRGQAEGESSMPRIYVRSLDEFDARPIPGTDGASDFSCSGDGRWIAFTAPAAATGNERKLAKVPIDGGSPPVTLTLMKETWGESCWLPNGDLLLSTYNGESYVRIPSREGATGTEHPMRRTEQRNVVHWSDPLPDGQGVLATASGWQSDGYHVSAFVLDLRTDSLRSLFAEGGYPHYSPTGHVIFTRYDVLFAAPFDAATQTVTGEAVALSGGLRAENAWSHARFYMAGNGTLLYPPGGRTGSNRRLVWIDNHGGVTPLTGERRPFEEVAARRDGKQVAVTIPNARGLYEVWLGDSDRPEFRPIASFPGADCSAPVWSPDGRRIAIERRGLTADDGIYVVDATGAAALVRASMPDSSFINYYPWSWSADGSQVLATREDTRVASLGIVSIPADGSHPPASLSATPGHSIGPVCSPDGAHVAWSSDVTGRSELYVAEYHAPAGLGTPVRVTSDGIAQSPTDVTRFGWCGSGELVYVDLQRHLMSVRISMRPSLSAPAPVLIADLRALHVDGLRFDPVPDGRIIAIQDGDDEGIGLVLLARPYAAAIDEHQ